MKFWNWLNNKKTVIAVLYWNISSGLIAIWYPSGMPDTLDKWYLSIGTILTAIGLGHKGFKAFIGVKN